LLSCLPYSIRVLCVAPASRYFGVADRQQTVNSAPLNIHSGILMGVPREPTYSLLVVACFSRHTEALDWAVAQLTQRFGKIVLTSPDFSFHHTKYYHKTMGANLLKRLIVFDAIMPADCLPAVKRWTIELEEALAATHQYPEERPLNLDPGLVQLGKFLLATTKDQAHRVYLQDDIFAEVTLRFQAGAFEPWEWTYADYREEAVRAFLDQARAHLYEQVTRIRQTLENKPNQCAPS
jgi:hypothetical protein